MEDNKNQDMSVDELLEMLKASLQEDDTKAEENTPAKEEIAETEESAESVEDVEPVEAEVPASKISEDDILKAWGISRDEMEQQKVDAAEEVRGAEVTEAAAPAVSAAKAYYITRVEKKEEFRARKASEAQRQTVDYDRTDYSLIKQALGMEKPEETDDGVQEFYTVEPEKETTATMTIDVPHDEFTYQRQKEDIVADYKRSLRSSAIKLIFSAAVAVLLFLLEALPAMGVTLPNALNADYYPVVFSMAAMQFAWIAGAFCYKEIANGFLSMRAFRITSGSVLGLLLVFTSACNIVNCAMGTGAQVYNFAVAFSALLIRVFDYMDIRREIFAFNVASSTQAKKYVMVPLEKGETADMTGLEEYCDDESLVLRTEKCSFVENYFARTEKRSDSEANSNKYLVPVIVTVAVALAILCGVRGSAEAAVGAFGACLAVGLPMLIMLSASYPLFKAGAKLSHSDSAIIGETSVEEYAGTTMICFDDADAFPSYGVALENLRIYGSGDIETIIEQMDAVFSKLGGPLHSVFALMISECPKPYRVKVEGVYDDGICAVVDGKTLFIGSAAYMARNNFVVTDKSNEIGGKHFSTMYLAEDGALRAKFYIRYTLDGSFETIVKKLARRGIASVILTGDSNINDELLSQFIDIARLPVKVVRRRVSERPLGNNRADSGIVSAGAVGDVVSTVTMCDKLAGVINTLRAVRIASVILCAVIAIGAVLLNMSASVSTLHVMIYHLFWLIPTWLVAKINL